MTAKYSTSPVKHWCFTINNYTDETVIPAKEDYEYMIIGREIGEKCGTPHLQGYVCMKVKKRLTAMRKIIPIGHLEKMLGTPQQASDYCKKDLDYTEDGILPESPHIIGGRVFKRNYDKAFELAKEGKIDEIDKNLLVPYYNTWKRIKSDYAPKLGSMDNLKNEWHYGPTGTGKSRTVRTQYPEAFLKDKTQWWDGYSNEPVVIIEEVDIYDVKMAYHFKMWGDHYPFPANYKGQGKLDIRPEKIIVTSNHHPNEIWQDDTTLETIVRRYHLIKYNKEFPKFPIKI